MSLRPLVSSTERRGQRDDELAAMRSSAQRAVATNQLDKPTITPSDSRQTTPAPTPVSVSQRRQVIIPDPVAFR